jgi:catechol 2,3-dioxygenase-like lactoylglutathione lyase family enzyme
MLERISAVTLATTDMAKAMAFYTALGFEIAHGNAGFTSFRIGDGYLNLALRDGYVAGPTWGRVIFYVADVDRVYETALEAGLEPDTQPRDAEWQERYFHILDPDGHELSFARPLATRGQGDK